MPTISAFAEDFGPRSVSENFEISPYPLKNYSVPTFTDLNGNDLLDLVVGNGDGTLDYYEQESFNSLTFRLIKDKFNAITLSDGFASPLFTDINGDGLLDLLVGSAAGNIAHYEQTIQNGLTFNMVTANFNEESVNNGFAPNILRYKLNVWYREQNP